MRQDAEKRTPLEKSDFPVHVGRFSGQGPAVIHACYHEEMEIMLVLRGSGLFFIRDEVYRFQKNSVLIIHGNEIHNYIPNPRTFYDSVFIVLRPELLAERPDGIAALESLSSCHNLVVSERMIIALESYAREIQEEYALRRPRWQAVIRDNVEKVLISLERAKDEKSSAPDVSPFAKELISYIDSRLVDRLSLTDVASHFHRAPSSLSRMFKRYVGIGFQEYLIHRRVSEARKLLEETDLKISALGRRVGFTDVSTFYRDFKLLTGFTPSAYRKLTQKQAGSVDG